MDMTALEIARALADAGDSEGACRAYALLTGDAAAAPGERMEAALYTLQEGGDYRIAYTCLIDLYLRGHFREDILGVLTEAFYEPNILQLRECYERNRKLLSKYPYLFRKDFPAFEELPLRFYPYDENRFFLFSVKTQEFNDLTYPKDTVITRNFFKDLEKPILASDVYSQYELEYLRDNVRKSEYVARENHVYLHYSDWGTFCSWLQVLNAGPLLKEQKIVFLIEDEIQQYPIDFKARFGIDYTKNKIKPVEIREITRLIWHTQLSTHNGGDLFNEVFDAHPNLLAMPSMWLTDMDDYVATIRDGLDKARNIQEAWGMFKAWKDPRMVQELYLMRDPTEKDMMVASYLGEKEWTQFIDPASRIAPAVFFQPHFPNINFTARVSGDYAVLDAEEMDECLRSRFLNGFKYVKTFTPLRRFTTSYAASMRFAISQARADMKESKETETNLIGDIPTQRVMNRSFMCDTDTRLYRDSVVVRFEDAKLNPTATFSSLAAFLDLPYTESMTYCSERGDANFRDEKSVFAKNGFNPVTVYRKYEEFASTNERRFIEYFLRDAYAYYGYNLQYYDGSPADEAQIKSWLEDFSCFEQLARRYSAIMWGEDIEDGAPLKLTEDHEKILEANFIRMREQRRETAMVLQKGLRFVNREGAPLQMIPMLRPDPALLEQPLYH